MGISEADEGQGADEFHCPLGSQNKRLTHAPFTSAKAQQCHLCKPSPRHVSGLAHLSSQESCAQSHMRAEREETSEALWSSAGGSMAIPQNWQTFGAGPLWGCGRKSAELWVSFKEKIKLQILTIALDISPALSLTSACCQTFLSSSHAYIHTSHDREEGSGGRTPAS